ncbi:MAG: NAD(P)-dependent oxidoreductase [Nitrospirales bacterium]
MILGASGVIGKAVTRLLSDRGVPQLCLSSTDINLVTPSASQRLCQLLRSTDSMVVLASLPLRHGRGLNMMVANVEIGLTIASAIAKTPIAHVVYVSSDAVYPRRIEDIDESTSIESSDPYAAMHILRERMFANLNSIPVARVRTTQVSSPDDTHNAYGPNRFRRTMIEERRIALFGEGEERRDHIMVQDVAAIIYRCLLHRSHGILNAVTGRSLTFAEVAKIVSSYSNFAPTIEFRPREVSLTHRRFDASLLKKMFPDFQFIPFERGEEEIQQRLSQHTICPETEKI